jgi:TubC N-terminal docking domain
VTAAMALVERLRARGVELTTDGRRIGVSPVGVLTDEDRAALKRHKAEVVRLLGARPTPLMLDEATLREVLGRDAKDPHAVACVRFGVLAAVHEIETGIGCGLLPPRRLVHGRPLCDWLSLDDMARLLRDGARP